MSAPRDENVRACARRIAATAGAAPRVAVILGSGLGAVVDALDHAKALGYEDLPGFPLPSIEGHAGRLTLGQVDGLPVAVLQGRVHYYERGEADAMAVPLHALRAAGCESLIMTNAAGSLHQAMAPGSLMLVTDHINLTGANPLIGSASDGRAFIDMSEAYDHRHAQALRDTAVDRGIELFEGVYACFSGPSFETPAEIRAARVMGADAVGMSTVPEAILARYCGLRVAAVSVITNHAAGISKEPLSHEQTMRSASAAAAVVSGLICGFLTRLAV